MSILAYGGQVTLIGLLIVFTGLFILIGCIKLMSVIFDAINGKKKNKPAAEEKPAAPAAPVIEEKPEEPEIEEIEEDDTIDPQVIAVISAAIAAYDKDNSLVVRSVRRSRGWQKAARDEAVSRF